MALRLSFRPVRRRDRAAVAAICARTWHGWDYVMLFFDNWVREPDFLAVEQGGRLAGFGKATELAPGHWWLEGLRVDPARRGQGIATALSDELLGRTLARAPRSVRLATADVNVESLRIIRRMGFRELVRTKLYRGAPPVAGAGPAPLRIGAEEAGEFLAASGELRANRGLLPYTWLFPPADRVLLARLARAGAILGWRQRGRLAGMLIIRPHRYRPQDLELSFAGGDGQARAAMRAYLRRRAARCGAESVSAMAAGRQMRRALREFGIGRHAAVRDVLVFEHPAAQSAGLGRMK